MSWVDDIGGALGGDSFWGTVAKNAVPALFTSLAVKPPDTTQLLNSMLPYYKQVAASAQQAQQVYTDRYLPAADRAAAGANSMQSPGDAAGQAATDFKLKQAQAQGALTRNLTAAGVRPDSGAFTGALAQINGPAASAGEVDAMNRAGTGAAAAKQNALAAVPGMYAATPYPAISGMYGAAASGMGNLATTENTMYRQKVQDVMAGLKPSNNVQAPNPNGGNVVNYYYGANGSPTADSRPQGLEAKGDYFPET